MKSQSTDIEQILLEITKNYQSYYIKQKSLNSFVNDKTIIYSHFKKISGKITLDLIKKHLNKEITLAIDLKKENVLLFEYRGNRVYAFTFLFFKLIEKKEYLNNRLIIKYSDNTVLIYLNLENRFIKDFKKEIEESLLEYFKEEWKIYPIKNKPTISNLMELPREYIEFEYLKNNFL